MKKGFIYFLVFIFALFSAKNNFETASLQEVSSTAFLQKNTPKSFLHKVEKNQHKENLEKSLSVSPSEDNFSSFEIDYVSVIAAISIFTLILHLCFNETKFAVRLPKHFSNSKRYLVLKNIRI